MNVAFCYENVLPTRGGCETYIADLARRLVADGHEVHLYACKWDATRLPAALRCHALPAHRGPRFLRPWRFGRLCEQALANAQHDVSLGFDKTWGQDVLYPQGGLHAASMDGSLRKYPAGPKRELARLGKYLDLAHWSFTRLEREQYLGPRRPLVIVNSLMVRRHFQRYYDVPADDVCVVRSAIDTQRFADCDRLRRRLEGRQRWGIGAHETVALFAAMNYRLKGLDPLLYAVRHLCTEPEYRAAAASFRLLVVGHPNTAGYESLARQLGIRARVCFAGHCDDMRYGYFSADFLAHPTFYDPCSLVVLEALACSLPVITSRSNGASELLHPLQEGFVIDDPHDHRHLAWCLAQLLDPARRNACAQAARRTAAQWTFEHHYRDMVAALTRAAARRRTA